MFSEIRNLNELITQSSELGNLSFSSFFFFFITATRDFSEYWPDKKRFTAVPCKERIREEVEKVK